MKNIPLFKVAMHPEAGKAIEHVLQSGFIGEGNKSKTFEDMLKLHFNNSNVVLTNSGTSAIHLALDVIRETHNLVPEETEVLCPVLSCLATAMPIKSQGFKIKWVDINPTTFNLDLVDVADKLNEKTRILVVVHWGGSPVDIDKLGILKKNYYERYGKELIVIEDAAHCFNSKWDNNLIGNSGNYVCFSFQAIKFLTTGDGGMLIAPDEKLAKQAKLKRWFGLDRESGQDMRCTQSVIYNGFKMQPNDILSTLGICNFDLAIKNVKKHQENAKYYNDAFIKDPLVAYSEHAIGTQYIPHNAESSCWLYTIFINKKEDFKRKMKSKGIGVSEVHTRMDVHPVFKSSFDSFLVHNMNQIENNYISIPVGWWVTEEDREYIVQTIKEGW